MIYEEGKLYTFEYYNDQELAARITYWESVPRDAGAENVLECMYAERDRRIDHILRAWVTPL